MLSLFVTDAQSGKILPAVVRNATEEDLKSIADWQTKWTSSAVREMPNKVALRLEAPDELLGLMSYEVDKKAFAVEIVYRESARSSNANLLHAEGRQKQLAWSMTLLPVLRKMQETGTPAKARLTREWVLPAPFPYEGRPLM